MSALLDYATAGARVAERALVQRPRLGREERLVFVVGCPRSGTTFVGRAIGGLPGLRRLRRGDAVEGGAAGGAVGGRAAHDPRAHPAHRARVGTARRRADARDRARARRGAGGLSAGARGARLRDGRDVVCSLLERGWLNADAEGRDDARLPYGSEPRFWVEPERREEFAQVSDARRCAWAWRRYVEAVRAAGAGDRLLEIRYEEPRDRGRQARGVPRRERDVDASRAGHVPRLLDRPLARELTPEQLADVEAEAGLCSPSSATRGPATRPESARCNRPEMKIASRSDRRGTASYALNGALATLGRC